MATRKKKVIITGVSREAADEAFAAYAKSDAQVQKINADIELQCAKIREKYADKAFDTLQAFATENQAELFAKKKSLDMAHGTIGFRTGTPKLKTLKGFTWASALNLIKNFLPSYIRQTEEIAKDKLLADREMVVMLGSGDPNNRGYRPLREQMVECGIQIVQEEAFYVEPKREDAV